MNFAKNVQWLTDTSSFIKKQLEYFDKDGPFLELANLAAVSTLPPLAATTTNSAAGQATQAGAVLEPVEVGGPHQEMPENGRRVSFGGVVGGGHR